MIKKLKDRVNDDAALVRRGRWVSLSFLLGYGEIDYIITIASGKIEKVVQRQLATHTGCFAIRATRETWEEHWSIIPRRDYHDIWSMLPKGLVAIDGDCDGTLTSDDCDALVVTGHSLGGACAAFYTQA